MGWPGIRARHVRRVYHRLARLERGGSAFSVEFAGSDDSQFSNASPGANAFAESGADFSTLSVFAHASGSTGLPLPSFSVADPTASLAINLINDKAGGPLDIQVDLGVTVSLLASVTDPLSEFAHPFTFITLIMGNNIFLYAQNGTLVNGLPTFGSIGNVNNTISLLDGGQATLRLNVEALGLAAAVPAVPAPATLLLLGAGLSGLAAWRLRLRR